MAAAEPRWRRTTKTSIYRITASDGSISHVKVLLERENDHYVCWSVAVDDAGNEIAERHSMTPRFYGITEEQSLRRMLTALENSYEEVERLEGP